MTGWVVSQKIRMSGWENRTAGWFIDRRFFMRANGQFQFLNMSAQLQRRTAATLAPFIGVWLLVPFAMPINQVVFTAQRLALFEQEASAEERVGSYRGSINEVTQDLERRQEMLGSLGNQYFGDLPDAAAQAPSASADSREEEQAVKTIKAVVPEAAGLARFEMRLNGQAINPHKFLEANPDVLKIQTVAEYPADSVAKE